jgi:drug/metabolite transporter (DMT)-like permease
MHVPLGEACALGAALAWAGSLVLFRKVGGAFSPIALNLFKSILALVLMGVTLSTGFEQLPSASESRTRDLAVLVVSGVVGIALADTLLFRALHLIGVGLLSIVDCLYTPLVILFAWLLLGERLVPLQWAGIALILAGVLLASRHAPPADRTPAQLLLGIALGATAIACMAFAIVLAKPALERWPLFWATTIRMIAGTAALLLLTPLLPQAGRVWTIFRPAPAWKWLVPACVLGAYVSLLLWVAGFKHTHNAAVAAVLNQTSTIFALLLATLALREPFGRRKLAAVSLAFTGVLLVTLQQDRSALRA